MAPIGDATEGASRPFRSRMIAIAVSQIQVAISSGLAKTLAAGKTRHCKAPFSHPRVAPSVVFRSIAHVVTPAVDLDHQLGVGAVEVGDVWADGMLAADTGSIRLASAEANPEQHFRRAHGRRRTLARECVLVGDLIS